MPSQRRTLNRYDIYSWLVNIAIFGAPVIAYILTQIQQQEAINWVTVEVIGAGLLLNLLKKLINNGIPPTAPVS